MHRRCRDFAVTLDGLPSKVQLTVRDSGFGFDFGRATQKQRIEPISMRDAWVAEKRTFHYIQSTGRYRAQSSASLRQ